jgi:hypothetical protein
MLNANAHRKRESYTERYRKFSFCVLNLQASRPPKLGHSKPAYITHTKVNYDCEDGPRTFNLWGPAGRALDVPV